MPIVDIEQPAAFPADAISCLKTVVSAQLTPDGDLNVAIEAAFLPVPIKRGVIVLFECQVGTTGARFEATAERATLENLTVPDKLQASHTIAETTEHSTRHEPSVKAKTGSTEFEFTLGSDVRQGSKTSSTTFAGNECRLAIAQSAGSYIRWHLRRDRAGKAVVDYLEGNLDLRAKATWPETLEPIVIVRAQPTDVRFFGPHGEVLSRRSSIGLWIKLHVTGRAVPSRDATRHVVRVLKGSPSDAWARTPLS